jgi:hypothetical protein
LSALELAFSVEPVTGWRIWRVSREIDRRRTAHELAVELLAAERRGETGAVARLFEPRLRSLTELGFWPARERLTATCGRGAAHTAPQAACECGVWAFRAYERAYAELLAYAHGATPVLLGRVRMWGRLVEAEHGWRAQYAYPADLTVFGGDEDVATALEAAYGVPVTATPWPAEQAA